MFDVARGWHRILNVLEKRRLLPSDALTPAELAHRIREQTQDERIERFVWRFYYPGIYGQCDLSGLSDEAEQIVCAIEGHDPAAITAAPAVPVVNTSATSTCPVCGRQSAKRRSRS